MPNDRDLIAEGRAKLAALTDAPSTDRAFELAEWAGLNIGEILQRWESDGRDLRAHAAVLEQIMAELVITNGDDEAILPRIRQLRTQRDSARREYHDLHVRREELVGKRDAARAALGAAHRPPLGYVAGCPDYVDGQLLVQADAERAFDTREAAQQCVDQLNRLGENGDDWLLLEVRREVQP